ncbi:MAG: TldD/PmbA family protein [Eubacteriales bacterium]
MLNDLITKRKSEFHPGTHTELRAQISKNRAITLVSGNLTANTRNEVSGVSARVYKNGVYGFSSAASYDDDAVKSVLDAAKNNADFMDTHLKKQKPMFPPQESGSRFADTESLNKRELPPRTYIDFAKQLDGYISNTYPSLASRVIAIREDSMEKFLAVSDGYDTHFISPRSYVYVFLTAETKDGMPVELFAPIGGYGSFGENFTDPALLYPKVDELHAKLMQKREGVFAKAGLKTVVLGGDLSGMLAHEAVGHTVEADLVLGGSVAGHNLGKKVASDLISLVDFAHTAFDKPAPLPVYVDDEGVPATDALLIDKGNLVGYMNNRETAHHFGMKPNGNARAFLFSDEPLIRMRNTAVLPGSNKLDDLIASVDDGYYLISSNNGQADTTGEFMFGITMGYEIKGGKLGHAILDTTITGVAFEMLKTVDMVSDSMNWSSSGYCGKKQQMPVSVGGPELRCKVTIGGR